MMPIILGVCYHARGGGVEIDTLLTVAPLFFGRPGGTRFSHIAASINSCAPVIHHLAAALIFIASLGTLPGLDDLSNYLRT